MEKEHKYLVSMWIYLMDATPVGSTDNLCLFDNREDAMEYIKEHYERNKKVNEGNVVPVMEPNITDMGTIVRWRDELSNKQWYWEYGIFPIPYKKHENNV